MSTTDPAMASTAPVQQADPMANYLPGRARHLTSGDGGFANTLKDPNANQAQTPDIPAANVSPTNAHDTRPAPAPPVAAVPKKGKQKKAMDSNEASKLVAARISQLELDAAGEKDQEAEIEREVKKANRELHSQTMKMSDIQKIEHLHKRASDFFAELKRHERESLKHKKRADQLQKEKDTSRSEMSKTNSLKEKLEKLCRELQKENNKLKNEYKTMSDAQVRDQNFFDEKYSTLLQKLDDYQEEKDNPKKQVVDIEVDELFRHRFKSLVEQYELRELHFHSSMRAKELDVQFNLAKSEREKKNGEALNAQVQTFSKTENDLRQQLNVYVDKFKQVEDTLNNSNDLFLTFRKEMTEMQRKTRKLEKQNKKLKRRQKAGSDDGEASDEMIEDDRTKLESENEALRKKEITLIGIIKQMQQQGRGLPLPGSTTAAASNGHVAREAEFDVEDESSYEYEGDEDGDEDEGSDEDDEYDDETEDEVRPEPRLYGPERPPPPVAATNGHH